MKELWLFTRKYPQGTGEAFLHSALPVWAQQFSRVRIFPMFDGEGDTPLPPGVEGLHLWPGQAFHPLSVPRLLRQPAAFLRMLRRRVPGTWPDAHAISHVRQLMEKARVLDQQIMPAYHPDRVVLLSVWMEDWVNVLGLLKERDPRIRFATLAHGSDLFMERHARGRIPFRRWQMQVTDRVLTISRHGAQYLRERFPAQADKVSVQHLGTADHGMGPHGPCAVLRLVSCAYLRAPKQVVLLAEALRHVRIPVHWTHFGDGPDRARLEAVVAELPAHITVFLRGAVTNEEVLRWYQHQPVDLFVHLSAHEGVPVALMEAISFGIPVLANAVGGVAELVDDCTGLLVPSAVDARQLAELLGSPAIAALRRPAYRQAVRDQWSTAYRADANYEALGRALPGMPDRER